MKHFSFMGAQNLIGWAAEIIGQPFFVFLSEFLNVKSTDIRFIAGLQKRLEHPNTQHRNVEPF